MSKNKKEPLQGITVPIIAMAEEASIELQRQADEADKELQKQISPLWDAFGKGGHYEDNNSN